MGMLPKSRNYDTPPRKLFKKCYFYDDLSTIFAKETGVKGELVFSGYFL